MVFDTKNKIPALPFGHQNVHSVQAEIAVDAWKIRVFGPCSDGGPESEFIVFLIEELFDHVYVVFNFFVYDCGESLVGFRINKLRANLVMV